MNAKNRAIVNARLHSYSTHGHSVSYNIVLTKALDEFAIALIDRKSFNKISSEHIHADFFPMIENNWQFFILTALNNVRNRRRTVGLLFRPSECFRGPKFKMRVKRLIFTVAKHIPGCTVLTILPFSVDERFSQIATDWIYDPQFWDLPYLSVDSSQSKPDVNEKVLAAASGRKIVIALGLQNRMKGFKLFCELWCKNEAIREKYLFVSAGVVDKDHAKLARDFEELGGICLNRYVEEFELLDLYSLCDAAWACYAPDYDQSSGIFGRSFQFGKSCIVRKGSHLEALSHVLEHSVLAIPFDESEPTVKQLTDWEPKVIENYSDRHKQVTHMRARDVSVLYKSFVESASRHSSP